MVESGIATAARLKSEICAKQKGLMGTSKRSTIDLTKGVNENKEQAAVGTSTKEKGSAGAGKEDEKASADSTAAAEGTTKTKATAGKRHWLKLRSSTRGRRLAWRDKSLL